MSWLFMLLPGFISASFTEKLENQTLPAFSYLKLVCIYDLFINLCSAAIYHYVIRTTGSILENFQYNTFLIHFGILNILLAIFLPIICYAVRPWFSIHLEKRISKESRNIANEK